MSNYQCADATSTTDSMVLSETTYATTMIPTQESNVSNHDISHTENTIFIPAPPQASSRYNRQLLIPSISLSGQSLIFNSKVLIIGLGGLGSPASLYLAGAGVGTLGLCDGDVVELGNLHRQIVHRESSLGNGIHTQSMTKMASTIRGCKELNSEVEYIGHEVRLDGRNALEIIKGYDIVLDCTDNPATRYLISDVCVVLGKILVSGAAQRLEGQIVILNYPIYENQESKDKITPTADIAHANHNQNGTPQSESQQSKPINKIPRGPCYRCIFPIPPAPEMVKGCNEIGILGPVVGTIGTLMASETLRVICRPKEPRKPTMLLYNAWSADPRGIFRSIGLRGQRKDCVSCGDDDMIKSKGKTRIDEESIRNGLMDYEVFCGRVEDVDLLGDRERVEAGVFLDVVTKDRDEDEDGKGVVVVDVREELEIELGSKIQGSVNIPISRILRSSVLSGTMNERSQGQEDDDELEEVLRKSDDGSVYFICQRGNDSQLAARKLIDRQKKVELNGSDEHSKQSRWIGDVKGGLLAIEKAVRK